MRGNKQKDNGRLPLSIPQPTFLADFNHGAKVVGKSVSFLASMPKKDSSMNKATAEIVKTNWGAMLGQIRKLDYEKDYATMKKKVIAPIEHLYDNHDHCDDSWCQYLKAKNEKKTYQTTESHPMFSKTENPKEYQQLLDAVKRFQQDESIKECLHMHDTQLNESLNMSVSRYVPKFKHFETTTSLDSRVRLVVGVYNMGYANYYLTLLSRLGCISENEAETRLISTGITRINKAKLRNRKMEMRSDFKRRRKHGQLTKTKQQLYEEGVDRANRLGTYGSGIDITESQEAEPTPQSSTTRPPTRAKVCNKCGATGHATWRSSKCHRHHEYQQSRTRTTQQSSDDSSHNTQLTNTTINANEEGRSDNVTTDVSLEEVASPTTTFAMTAKS